MNYADNAPAAMIVSQLRPSGVHDKAVIAAISSIDRRLFVAKGYEGVAYLDHDVAMGEGRMLLSPLAFAMMLEKANLLPSHSVLVVGCGSGYSLCVLSQLVTKVIGIESHRNLASTAHAQLQRHGVRGSLVLNASLNEGYDQEGPYDRIFIEGAVEYVPDTLLQQLSEGGILLVIDWHDQYHGNLTLITRKGNRFISSKDVSMSASLLKEFQHVHRHAA